MNRSALAASLFSAGGLELGTGIGRANDYRGYSIRCSSVCESWVWEIFGLMMFLPPRPHQEKKNGMRRMRVVCYRQSLFRQNSRLGDM